MSHTNTHESCHTDEDAVIQDANEDYGWHMAMCFIT